MKPRVLFMGTPSFGIPSLRRFAQDTRFELVGLVTMPDKPAGRGQKMTPPLMKPVALDLGIPVLQPASLRTPDAQRAIAALRPDVIAVAAYGLWIPEEVFDMPPKRSVNLHPSLLPRHRGAAPVMSAILAGDREVGLSALFVEDEMDSGDLLGQLRFPMTTRDTTEEVMRRLSFAGAQFFVDTLWGWMRDEITPQSQDLSQSTWIDRLEKSAGQLDWNESVVQLDRRCRAYTPWPGTYTFYEGRKLLIHHARPLLIQEPGEEMEIALDDLLAIASAEPGTVLQLEAGYAVVASDGALILETVQLESRRRMSADAFARGQKGFVGSRLG